MKDRVGSLPKRGLKRVRIERLFGHYNYDLPGQSDSFSEVAILYGDNGSGKTTILTLLFHLLSAATKRGHRYAVSEVPFRLVQIDLHDGTRVTASREETPAPGPFSISCERPGEESIEVRFEPTSDTQIQPQEREQKYIAFLSDLGLSLNLLSADREILSDDWRAPDPEEEWMEIQVHPRRRVRGRALQELRHLSLEQAISHANSWISRVAVQGTNIGSDSANEIYERIVNRIADSPFQTTGEETGYAHVLAQDLEEIAARSEKYSRFQLIPALRVNSLIQPLLESQGQTTSIIARVLEPYIDGIRARLDALANVQRITEALVRNLNDFFGDKRISFDIADGIQFTAKNGVPLEPRQLSSGEQQLLRLFCHTIVSRDRASIFIIDEPELSLNVKWQRKLIGSLLELVEGSEIQFVFATHSLELLAQHRQSVVNLSAL